MPGTLAKGTTVFSGFALPGVEFSVASRSRRPRSRADSTGAMTVSCDCGVTTSELEAEVDESLFVPIDLAEVEARRNEPDLVADPLGDDGGLRVVEHDAVLVIEP